MILVQLIFISFVVKIAGYLIIYIFKKLPAVRPLSSGEKSDLSVDIIVPMYNEEKVIVNTINNLLKIDFHNFNIIIIDDGSSDHSLKIVQENFNDNRRISILSQKNFGKSTALNTAIKSSTSDIIFCIDADTLVRPDAVSKMMPYFRDQEVAAVSGYIKVGNKNNPLTKMQYVEYITNQNFERIVFDVINGIVIVPGAIGAFRRSVIEEVGGYLPETLSEDSDITVRILNKRYIIKKCIDAVAFTEAPSNLRMFIKQRTRWKIGSIQVLIKYQNEMFRESNGIVVRFLLIPYNWIFNIVLPVFMPVLDYMLLFALFSSGIRSWNFKYCSAVILIDTLMSIFSLYQSGEKVSVLHVIGYRFMLRHLNLIVYINAAINVLNGRQLKWNKVVREGTVVLE